LPEYEEEEVRVNPEAIARVGKQGYSVPARWAGRRLRARISETTIAFYKLCALSTSLFWWAS
jgi:hypothetical protein